MTYTALAGLMPIAYIIEALDDNGDGDADKTAWAEVYAAASERVSDAFGGDVPDDYADSTGYALKIFCAEILFSRRGFSGERNPYTKRAADQEQRLRKLASGAEHAAGAAEGSYIGDAAKINTAKGLII